MLPFGRVAKTPLTSALASAPALPTLSVPHTFTVLFRYGTSNEPPGSIRVPVPGPGSVPSVV